MRILIVGLVKNPQLLRLIEEGEKRGHHISGCYASDLILKASNDDFSVLLKSSPTSKNQTSITDYEVIYLWSVGKKRWEWYMASYFLNKNFGTKIVNSKVVDDSYKLYLTPTMNFYKQFKEKLSFPKSAVIFNEAALDEVLADFSFPLIVKTSQGRQGRGVFKLDDEAALRKLVREMTLEKEPIILREFIPNDGDIRVFTVGYKAIGAMKRTPTAVGEFRSNISVGGVGESFDLKIRRDIKEIAEKVSELTRTEIAGVDIMLNKDSGKPYILEVNPGPQFTGFEKFTGINAAGEILSYFESL